MLIRKERNVGRGEKQDPRGDQVKLFPSKLSLSLPCVHSLAHQGLKVLASNGV